MAEVNEHGQSNGDNTPITTTAAKKSVVDDFFSALFASNNASSSSSSSTNSGDVNNTPEVSLSSSPPPAAPAAPAAAPAPSVKPEIKFNPRHYHDKDSVADDDNNRSKDNININRKRERVLDEFDEYSLLSSKRRESSSKGNKRHNKATTTQSTGKNGNDVDEQSDGQILSKRDIDWSNVKPESRMLVRQLPKFIDKQAVMSHFSKYGEVLEVVQKSPFGFVHFENPDACAQAVRAENGQPFHGIILDLEICKRKPIFARAPEKEHHHQQKKDVNKNTFDTKNRRDNSSPAPPLPQQQQNNRKVTRPNNNSSNAKFSQASPPHRGGNFNNNSNNNSNNTNGYYNGKRNGNNQQHNSEYRPDYGNNYGDNNNYTTSYSRYGNDNNNNIYRPQQDRQGDKRYNGNNSVNNSYNYNGQAASSQYRNDNYRNNYNYEPTSSRYNNQSNNGVTPASYTYPATTTTTTTTAPASTTFSNNNNIISRRQGSDIPLVQIIAWDNVAYGYTDYIERVLSSNGIRSSSMTLTYSQSTREQIVKQMILEGVKAIVMIDHQNELQNKIYFQVFAPAEYGQQIRFDEYDSITALEAVSIFHRMYPPSHTATQPYISPPPAQALQPQAQPAAPAVDMNTLASIYSMLQQQQQQQAQPAPAPAAIVSPPTSNQATIPQLLATLVSGLGMSAQPQPQAATAATAAAAPPLVATAYSPPAPHYSPSQPMVTTTPDKNNIAALISTAAGGNPALAQLLAQMTTSVGANTTGNELHK